LITSWDCPMSRSDGSGRRVNTARDSRAAPPDRRGALDRGTARAPSATGSRASPGPGDSSPALRSEPRRGRPGSDARVVCLALAPWLRLPVMAADSAWRRLGLED
jgi:hypothetical protein